MWFEVWYSENYFPFNQLKTITYGLLYTPFVSATYRKWFDFNALYGRDFNLRSSIPLHFTAARLGFDDRDCFVQGVVRRCVDHPVITATSSPLTT